jgi:hypothetical protein
VIGGGWDGVCDENETRFDVLGKPEWSGALGTILIEKNILIHLYAKENHFDMNALRLLFTSIDSILVERLGEELESFSESWSSKDFKGSEYLPQKRKNFLFFW